mgnify:FL=1
MKNVEEFISSLEVAELNYEPNGTCNSQTCGHIRSKIHTA